MTPEEILRDWRDENVTPTTKQTPLDLDAIRADDRCARCRAGACGRCTDDECGCHAALRAELDAARAELRTNEDSEDARLAIAEAEVARLRAEQREALENAPTSDNDENTRLIDAVVFLKSIVGDAQGASDEWFTAQVRRMRDLFGFFPAARAERTEPHSKDHPVAICTDCDITPGGRLCDLHSGYAKERTEPATGEDVARMFHETYERLAPDYGYRTREASAKPWADVPTQNKLLMVATVTEVLAALDPPGREQALREDYIKSIEAVNAGHRLLLDTARAERDAANAEVAKWRQHWHEEREQIRESIAQDLLSLKDWFLGQDEVVEIVRHGIRRED